MTPVDGSSESPAGSAGLTLYEVTVPDTEGMSGMISSPAAALIAVCTYVRFDGGATFTITCKVADVEPASLCAETLYEACGEEAVGVPEIAPVDVFSVRPAGRAGVILYEVTEPVTVGTSGEIATPTVAVIDACG